MRTPNWLQRAAATVPDRLALTAGEERLTFAELEDRAATAARRLAWMGAVRGDRVALALEPSAHYVVLLHGLAKLGAVAVPLDPSMPRPALERRIEATGSSLLIADADRLYGAPEADVELDGSHELESVHCILHTSGTAGPAKPVQLTYGNHLWSALGSAARIGVDPADRWLCCLPLHHIGGLAIVLRCAVYGTTVAVERFDTARIAALLASGELTIASLVATTLSRLLDADADLASLRCVLLGGGPAAAELIERGLDAGAPLAPTYGLTETASQVTTLPPGEARRRPGSAGTPLLANEVRVDGDGSILVRGPTVAPGMAHDYGWFRTGDFGRLDENGHLYVRGRADDVIVSGGENVSPLEVEQALVSHPAVSDAAVIAREDPEWQQAVVAVVVLRDGKLAGERELVDHCRGLLAPHQVPKQIRTASRLPRDAQGKLRRRELEWPDQPMPA